MSKVNIQLALDRLTRDQCFEVLRQTEDFIDWIEVGTGVIKEYGTAIIREVKKAYPEKTVVADMKTCDAGKHEAVQAFEAGADITTVMAFSADQTIQDTLEVARQYKKRIMIDLLGVSNKERIKDLERIGVELVSLHFGKDMQKEGKFQTDLFRLVEDSAQLEVAVAGGINLKSLPAILEYKLDTVIVGSAITKAEDRKETAAKMQRMIRDEVSY